VFERRALSNENARDQAGVSANIRLIDLKLSRERIRENTRRGHLRDLAARPVPFVGLNGISSFVVTEARYLH